MKKLIVILLVCNISITFAQEYRGPYLITTSSLDIVTDASSLALGEALVANKFFSYSFFSNPAALQNQKGVNIFYNYRSLNWSNYFGNAFYFSAGAQSSTSIGNIGISINQLYFEKEKTSYDRVFILTYSRTLVDNIMIGINAKLFNRNFSVPPPAQFETTPALIFDLGLIYNVGKIISEEKFSDDLNLGLSIQNFGTDYRETVMNQEDYFVLPRYLRFGFSYKANFFCNQENESNLDLLVTTEYRNLLNAPKYMNDSRDNWGVGFEALFFKVFSLRYGGIISPSTDIFSERGKFISRYGFGFQLPFEKLGLKIPITIKFDYTPLQVQKAALQGFQNNNTLNNFTLLFSYNKDLF